MNNIKMSKINNSKKSIISIRKMLNRYSQKHSKTPQRNKSLKVEGFTPFHKEK